MRRWRVGLGLAALGALAVGSGRARAQPSAFLAKVDRAQVALGEAFTYEVTLSMRDDRVGGYRPPDFRGFRVLGEQPSQSTQIQMSGGGTLMQSVYSWRYQLEPMHKGNLTIGPARVRVGDRDLSTESIGIRVLDGTPPRAAPPPAAGSVAPAPAAPAPRRRIFPGLDFPFGGPEPAPTPPAQGGNFLRVNASKTKAYVGEQITVEWLLYLTDRQDKYQTVTEPRTDGFWVEDIPVPNQRGLSLSRQTYAGQAYLVATLLKKALFPLQPGRLTVTALESEISQVDFFGSTLRTERLKAEPVTIEAVSLPTAGQPAGFDAAAVGRFGVAARVDRDRVAVGEAVTLTVTISGEGNLRKLPPPTLGALEGWKVYEPKVNVALEPGETVRGSKTVEYLLLPERPGATVLPAFALPFFDPANRAYATERSAPLRLEVTGEAAASASGRTPGAPVGAAAATAPAVGAENVLGMDIRPPRARASLRRDLGASFYRSRAFLGALAAPPLAFSLTVLIGRVRERLGQETERGRRRKLRRLVRRRLRTAEIHLQEGRGAPFYVEIERVLREFLSAKLGQPVTGLSREELGAELARAGVGAELVGRVIGTLEECDRGRFAPGAAGEGDRQAALERAGEVILQIEKSDLRPEAGS